MRVVLATLFTCIRDLAITISPVIPASAARLLDQLGVPDAERNTNALSDIGSYERLAKSGFTLSPPQPVFPRLELPESAGRSEEHTSELQSLMRISYAVFRLKKTK